MDGSGDFERLGELLPKEGASSGEAGRGGAGGSAGPPPCAGPRPRDKRRDPARRLAEVWPELVGGEVAANAVPVHLRNGRLVVSASSSAWAQTLELMSEAILARIGEHLGEGLVEKVTFQHAGWEDRPRAHFPGVSSKAFPERPHNGERRAAGGKENAHDLSDEQESVLAEIESLDLSPALREKIERAMKAAFVRTQRDIVR